MRFVGETVTIITLSGGGIDDDGYPLPEQEVRREIPGCVIIPKGGDVSAAVDYMLASNSVSILAPVFLEDVEDGARLEVRGDDYTVSAPVFHHRSVFGTSNGGTEIPAERNVGT